MAVARTTSAVGAALLLLLFVSPTIIAHFSLAVAVVEVVVSAGGARILSLLIFMISRVLVEAGEEGEGATAGGKKDLFKAVAKLDL